MKLINWQHKKRIRELYQSRFTMDELFTMYRDIFHPDDMKAIKQLRKITKGIERYERI